jgi:hypothetical protein
MKLKNDAGTETGCSRLFVKRLIVFATACIGIVCVLFGQGWAGSSYLPMYDSKAQPRILLPRAYELAVKYAFVPTNRFYCVSASCDLTNGRPSAGWLFKFANTNAESVKVKVYFNGEVRVDTNDAALLRGP